MNFDLDVSYKQQQKLVMTQQMKISINILQGFDPVGIAAKDIKQCLKLQVKDLQFINEKERKHIYKIIDNYILDVAEGKLEELSSKMKIEEDEVKRYIDELESTGNSLFFKGVSQLKRELRIEPKRFCIKEKNIDGSKVTACGETLYFKCDVKRLKWYVQECISDREAFEDMQCEEHYTSDEVKKCDTYIHVVS